MELEDPCLTVVGVGICMCTRARGGHVVRAWGYVPIRGVQRAGPRALTCEGHAVQFLLSRQHVSIACIARM